MTWTDWVWYMSLSHMTILASICSFDRYTNSTQFSNPELSFQQPKLWIWQIKNWEQKGKWMQEQACVSEACSLPSFQGAVHCLSVKLKWHGTKVVCDLRSVSNEVFSSFSSLKSLPSFQCHSVLWEKNHMRFHICTVETHWGSTFTTTIFHSLRFNFSLIRFYFSIYVISISNLCV